MTDFLAGALAGTLASIPAFVAVLLVLRWTLGQVATERAEGGEWREAAVGASVAAGVLQQTQERKQVGGGVHSLWHGSEELTEAEIEDGDQDDDNRGCPGYGFSVGR